MEKYVYSFSEGSKDMYTLLGNKGATLADMTNIGLPVPFGLTVTTQACNMYYDEGYSLAEEVKHQIFEKLEDVESVTGKKFGDPVDPLLLSARAGAAVSMPGMMDSILNLGMNDEITHGLMLKTDNPAFAYDTYMRFIMFYGSSVMGISKNKFDLIVADKRYRINKEEDAKLTEDQYLEIIDAYKELISEETGWDIPEDPHEQLISAVCALFRSWNNDRAKLYRKLNGISDTIGTAVNVQTMVFGNADDRSYTGVAFTRNPSDGDKKLFGELLINSQGEDVVSGRRTPLPISIMKTLFPDNYAEFETIAALLEKQNGDMQDLEFTVESGKLYMLNSRAGKRTPEAAVKIAVDFKEEGWIDKKDAVMRLDPDQMGIMLHSHFDADALKQAEELATGLPASPGAASGRVFFDVSSAVKAVLYGYQVVLIRKSASPEDLAGMAVAEGVLTEHGGMTSQAAEVARGMGKCCIAGCADLNVDEENCCAVIADETIEEGDFISLDGSTGKIFKGRIETTPPVISEDFSKIIEWADEFRYIKVRTNADNPAEARQAVMFGAEGIGLCRTEHMFFKEERLPVLRRMILADDEKERREALERILLFQKSDFKRMFETMGDRPVNIRLLDPMLHEFIPQSDEEIHVLADQFDVSYDLLAARVEELTEVNPMLGFRGCRLAIVHPEIIRMQAEAIMRAAIEVKREKKYDIVPEIMIPFVSISKEFSKVKKIVSETAEKVFEAEKMIIDYKVGTMMEIPRACLTADEMAHDAEFFSFGTNDLTQMTYGFSRDDTAAIIKAYIDGGVIDKDPFQFLDTNGVGKLIKMASEAGRQVRPNMRLGMCGENVGNEEIIKFCHSVGIDYISCSPFRVPAAKIVAAQSEIGEL